MPVATLIVLGSDLKPARVSALLGIRPDRAWTRGERKSFKQKDGSIRFFKSRHGRGGWKAFLKGAERRRSLPAQIRLWCERLLARRGAVRKLQRCGYSVVIDCCAPAPNCVHFSPELHRQLAELEVGLDITFYRRQEAPNQQSGPNGRQPARSGRIRKSAQAASRRLPSG
jgi:hypothetical protein